MKMHPAPMIFFVIIAFLVVILTPIVIFRKLLKYSWITTICLAAIVTFIIVALSLRASGPNPPLLLVLVLCGMIVFLLVWGINTFFSWLSSTNSANVLEREKIVQMIGSGKLTSSEGTELLEAMGQSSALGAEQKFSRQDIVMLVGCAIVVLGFFLPWTNVRISMPGLMDSGVHGYQAGYHVGATGWAVLVIATASAIPVFVSPRNFLYKMSMLQLLLVLLGVALTISVMVNAGSNMLAGIVMCLIGFVIEAIASCAKFRQLAA
jgi:hypothetical protein